VSAVLAEQRGCDHLDDPALVNAFESLAIRSTDFRHREHLRIAFTLLATEDFAIAGQRFRAMLRRFASSIGAHGKYHETLTWTYLAIIAERMHGRAFGSSHEFLVENSDLLDHRATIGRYYDVAAITASPIARAVFVLPRPR
jgi:hypothetical protein